MNKKIINRIQKLACVLMILFAAFCWYMGQAQHQMLLPTENYVTFHCENMSLTEKDFHSMHEIEQLATNGSTFALWTQKQEQKLSSDMGRETKSAVLTVCGDTRLALPISQTLAEKDESGCLIDRATALALFGNVNAQGAIIRYQEHDYIVRGVFDAPVSILVRRAAKNEKIILNSLTLGESTHVESFLLRHPLDYSFRLENRGHVLTSWMVCAAPVVMAVLLILWLIARNAFLKKEYPVQWSIHILCFLAVLTVAALLILYTLPAEWIPPKWSEFAYLGEAFQKYWNQTMNWIIVQKSCAYLMMMRILLHCMGWNLLNIIILLTIFANKSILMAIFK